MSTIHFQQTTTSTPQQFLDALTDFGPGRATLFANSTDKYVQVHEQGPTHADVTEGSRGIWERLRYDWSDPHRIVMTTIDSNLWGGASGHTYTLTPTPDGTTTVDAVVVRDGKNLVGRVLGGNARHHRQTGPEQRVRKGRQSHRSPQREPANDLLTQTPVRPVARRTTTGRNQPAGVRRRATAHR